MELLRFLTEEMAEMHVVTARLLLIAINLNCIDHVHLTANAAGTPRLVNRTACVFFRQFVDVVERPL